MREFLMHHHAPDMAMSGITLTVPGPPLPMATYRALWADYANRVNLAGLCCVWRVEIQARGALHWHLLAGSRAGQSPDEFRSLWLKALQRIGPIDLRTDDVFKAFSVQRITPWQGKIFLTVWKFGGRLKSAYSPEEWARLSGSLTLGEPIEEWPDLSLWPQADLRAVHISEDDGTGAWARYLNDHATKCKQEQIPESIGRHWGVVGRKHFEGLAPMKSVKVTPAQYAKVRRMYERLATPQLKNAKAPFGRSLGRRCKRGRRGTSVCFCQPDTVARMIDLAKS